MADTIERTPDVTENKGNFGSWITDQLIRNRATSLLALIIVVCIPMSIAYPTTFFSYSNVTTLLLSLSLDGILVIGMMYLMVSGVFDLSVGANVALGGAIAALLMKQWGAPIPIAIVGAVVVSAFAGLVNGFFVARVGVNALVATLASLGILRGIAIMLASQGIVSLPSRFVALGQNRYLGIQLPVFYMAVLVIVFAFLLARTRYFRQLYFIGGNARAAALSGINVPRTLITNFVVMGALCGIAGAMLTARLNAAIGTVASGEELYVITAAVIGGGSLSGGRGTVAGAFMGALFMALIVDVMVIADVNVYFQSIINGCVLLGAVSLDVILRRQYGGAGTTA